MSEEVKPNETRIPPGGALIFEDADGKVEWQMRNTPDGLVIETEQWVPRGGGTMGVGNMELLPVLRLKTKKRKSPQVEEITEGEVFVRGNMCVDGNLETALDCHKFCGKWEVIEGDMGHSSDDTSGEPKDRYYAHIILNKGVFELWSSKNDEAKKFNQKLYYNPQTGTLEDDPEDRDALDRCISFWDRRTSHLDKDRIFAIRRDKKGPKDSEEIRDRYLPWEYDVVGGEAKLYNSGSGSWGANEGGG